MPAVTEVSSGCIEVVEVAQGAPGPQGPIGQTGLTGIQGNAGPVGPVGLVWRGAWASGTDYVPDDTVGHNGSSWFAFADAPVGAEPMVGSAYWALLASQGAQGIQGSSVRYSTTIGDGAALTYTITHNLGTADIQVAVFSSEAVPPIVSSVTLPTINTAAIVFSRAPLLGSVRVVVLG